MRVTKLLRKSSLFLLFVSVAILIPAQTESARTELTQTEPVQTDPSGTDTSRTAPDPFEGIPADGQARFDALQDRAVAARDAGDTRTALAAYEEMQRLAPDSGELLYNRGTLHLEREEYDRSVTLLSRAIETGYAEAEVFYNRGNALFHRGRLEDARNDYHRAREMTPEDPEILNNLGLTELRLGAYEDAEAHLAEAADRDQAYPDPLIHLADLYETRGLFADAEAALDEAIRRSGTLTTAFSNRGALRYRQGNYAGAFDDFLTAHQLAPEDRDVLYNLGVTAIAAATDTAPRIILDEKE